MDLYAKLSDCMEELSATFSSRMGKYEEDLKNASSNEAAHKTIASLSREFTDFKCLIWKTMSALKNQMELLTVGLDRHEMASRRQVLLVHGLPEQKDEDPTSQAVLTITEKMKIANVSLSDITACHRLGVVSGKPRPLLVRFQSHSLRSEVWRSKPILKGSGLVLSEFLTKPRHDTFLDARKHFGVKQCWTSEGKIIILLPDKSRRKIECASDLLQLKAQFPTATSTADAEAAKGTLSPTGRPAPDKRSRKQAK